MKNKKLLCFILYSFSFHFLHSEYFIWNEIGSRVVPLADLNTNYRKAIDIRLKYQFPMSMNPLNRITEEEKQKLYSDEAYAEEIFLRRKIRTDCENLNIGFIPSVLFELFLLNLIHFNYDIETGQFIAPDFIADERFKEKKLRKPSEFIKYTFIINRGEDGLFRDASDFNKYVYSMSEQIETTIVDGNTDKVWEIFNKTNQFESVKKANFFIEKIITQFFLRKGIDFNKLIENSEELTPIFKEILDELIENIIRIKRENCLSAFYGLLDPSFLHSMLNRNLIGDEYIQSFISILGKSESIDLLKKVLEVEIRSRQRNGYLIYRGSNSSEKTYQDINKAIEKEVEEYEEDAQKEQEKIEKTIWNSFIRAGINRPRSISFSRGLFSGIVYDSSDTRGAVGFTFLSESKRAYALKVDKNNVQNLFFFPPTDRVVSFYGQGEWFHPRTKIAIPYAIAKNLDLAMFSIGGLSFDNASHGATAPLYFIGKFNLLENIILVNREQNDFERDVLDYISQHSINLKPEYVISMADKGVKTSTTLMATKSKSTLAHNSIGSLRAIFSKIYSYLWS
ncbi:hypothetical protein KAW80_02610 [Candidatus Babeliales bacterium]|nr:hypothetical protein [Candidatus Babeliales bacterium]